MKGMLTVLSVVLMACICQVALPTTYHVAPPPSGGDSNPGTEGEPFATIQRGIDAASAGDTVIVKPGTYIENISFKARTPKNIILRSTDPLDPDVVATTIIDGNQAGSVVTFSSAEDERCVLSGFTIRNGMAHEGGGICGGVWMGDHTHATITNNIITDNTGVWGAGVILCDGPIENNIITGNTSPDMAGGLLNCHGTIRNNTISANSAPNSSGGGLRTCRGTIENNVISENSAFDGGGLFGCSGTIQNNVISGNSAGQQGGGMSNCNGIIQNNIISGNQATSGTRGWGAGLFICGGATIRNNLIIGNTATKGGGLHWCDAIIESNTIVRNSATSSGGGLNRCNGRIQNCIIWQNEAPWQAQISNSLDPTYSCIQGWTGGGDGNISPQRPGFVDEKRGNYRLLPDSPCIDAGLNWAWMWDGVDLDENPRALDGDGDGDPVVDMGAYEYNFLLRVVSVGKAVGGEIQFTWSSRPADIYTIYLRTNMQTGTWDVLETVASQGTSTTWTHSQVPSDRRLFYRIGID